MADNPAVRAAGLAAEAKAETVTAARSWPEPTAGATYFPRSIITARGAQRTQWRIQQPLPIPGTRSLRGEVATLGARAARSQTGTLRQEVALQVRRAFYMLGRIQEQERLIRRFQDELRQAEEAALAQYEVGAEGQPAVLKAQIERQRLHVRLESLHADRQSTLYRLAELTGDPSLMNRPVVAELPPAPAPEPDPSTDVALQQRPEADALRATVRQSDRREQLIRREQWPSVTVGAQYVDIEALDLTPTMDGSDALALSVGVKLPLWRGAERARQREAELQRREAEERLDALQLEVQTTLARLRVRLDRQRRQLQILTRTLIPRAETAIDATLSAYRTGQSDFLDLLDAQRTLFQLRLDRADLRARILSTRAEQDRAAGRPSTASPR